MAESHRFRRRDCSAAALRPKQDDIYLFAVRRTQSLFRIEEVENRNLLDCPFSDCPCKPVSFLLAHLYSAGFSLSLSLIHIALLEGVLLVAEEEAARNQQLSPAETHYV
ncbi:unnamed protein product [Haemonchus placei]|uniref:Uncharacterized protein n=1 Tax=Haemonchus placei TaxID=6290 RepID=A0A3P7T7E5_HAEPC|nr:unnamed protein product [Haemonchus placei]